MQDSFSGGTKTVLIATVSPSQQNVEETISTLRFADTAKNVIQRVKRSETNVKQDAAVNQLQKEVSFLKELLQIKSKGQVNELSKKMVTL